MLASYHEVRVGFSWFQNEGPLNDKANLKMAKNKTMINKQEHWTYKGDKGPVGGLSVPDYILYSREITKAVSNYRLSWEANCDS